MTQSIARPSRSGVAGTAAVSRRGAGLLVLALAGGASVAIVGCGTDAPPRPKDLEGAAKDAEVARVEAALARLPNVTRVNLEFTDNITNGQGFMGAIYTDTNDQSLLDSILDGVIRILWGTTLFYPGRITTAVLSQDETERADYRTLGATAPSGISPTVLLERYGPPGFLLQTAKTSASRKSGAGRSRGRHHDLAL